MQQIKIILIKLHKNKYKIQNLDKICREIKKTTKNDLKV